MTRPLDPAGKWRRLLPFGAVLAVVLAVVLAAAPVPPAVRVVPLLTALVLSAAVTWTTHRLVLRSASDRAAADRESDLTAAVLDASAQLLIVLDDRGRVVSVNRRCAELTGLRTADVRGRPFFDITPPPETPPTVRAAFARMAADDFPLTYANHWTLADGRRLSLAWRATALADGDGAVTHVIAAGTDVTDQRETELILAHVLAAATDTAIVATGTDGVVTGFNAGAERMLGYAAEEVVGWVSPLLWHVPDELADRAAALGVRPGPALFRPADEIGPQEWTYLRRDGSRLPVVLTTTEIRADAGAVTGYLHVARDVTRERRGAEAMRVALAQEAAAVDRLRELDRLRGELVATVSHEVRAPLTSILGNVELLADGDAGALTGPQARLIAAVERPARRLLAFVEDLVMLSRIESGAVRIDARPVQVRAIVGGALEALNPVRAGRGVELSVDLPTEHLVVLGDRAQLERVLVDLVGNGLRGTPPGGLVRLTVDADEDGYARLVVSDTGTGVSRAEVDSLFDTRGHGTGLGLAITKSIVERHGGRIWAASGGDREGTEVTCLLPRA